MHPLRAKRKQAGLTLTALAARVGMTRWQIADLERGAKRMRVEEMLALAAELGCELSEILPPALARTEPSAS